MPFLLSEFERGSVLAGDVGELSKRESRRIRQGHGALVASGGQALILVEGMAGSAKTEAVRAVVCALDPLRIAVHRLSRNTHASHWLSPFWRSLPDSGEAAIFFRGWYSLAVARRLGGLPDREWARYCDEINEFEAQQTDHGLTLIKLFFHTAPSVRVARLAQRAAPEGNSGLHELPAREADPSLWEEMFDRCNTRWAPWTVIDSGDEESGIARALAAVADGLEGDSRRRQPA